MNSEVAQVRTHLNVAKLRAEFKGPHELITTSDGKVLFLQAWEAKNPSEVAILIFHGITGYSNPYGKFMARELSAAGFPTFVLNLRGHGLSDGARGDYPSKKRLAQDLCETISFVKQRFPKVVVLGHSLGAVAGVIAVNACPSQIDGLVLVGAGKHFRPGAIPKPKFSMILKVLLNRLFRPSKAVINYYRPGMTGVSDPLCTFNYTPRFMLMFRWQNMVFSQTLQCPVFVGVGDQDELFTVESARAFFDQIPGNNRHFEILAGAKHVDFPRDCWTPLIEWLYATI